MTVSLVSIIIPTYNRAFLLKEAVQSCINQTYRPIECIVVDDGSTDDTKKIIDDLQIGLDEGFTLKYMYQNNAGSQVARNTGTTACNGEFIQYLDSDDLLYPEKIEKQVKYLKENKDCDGVWGDWAKGSVEKNELINSWAEEDLLTQFFTIHCIVNFSFLMRKSIISEIGPWDTTVNRNQEIDFHLKGLLKGAKFKYQPQVIGLWRIHTGERIASTTGVKDLLYFYKKWEQELIKRGIFNNQMKINIANIYFWLAESNKQNKD